MKRALALPALLLFAPLTFGARAHAAHGPTTGNPVLSRLVASVKADMVAPRARRAETISMLRTLGSISGHTFSHLLVGRSVSAAPSRTTAAQLALPSNLIDPAYAHQGLFNAGGGPFGNFHSNWAGFQSGVGAAFDFQPIVTHFYAGSVLASSNAALTFMADSYNLTRSWSPVTPTDCTGDVGVPCRIVGFSPRSGQITIYTVGEVNNCVIETGYQGDSTLLADPKTSDTTTKLSVDLFLIGVNEAQAACNGSSPNPNPNPQPAPATPTPVRLTATPGPPTATPVPGTSFHLVSVQVVKYVPSSSGQVAPMSKVKVGKKVVLYTLVSVTSGRDGLSAQYTFDVKNGSGLVLHKSSIGMLNSPSAAGQYEASLPVKFNKKGSYVFTETVTIDGITQSGATAFKVVK